MGDVPDLDAVVGGRAEAADLEDELRVAVVHDGDLGVGGLPLVAIAEPAAQADDRPGIRRAGGPGRGDQPSGDVHLVDALIADVAVAEVPEPVPVVVDQVAVVGLLGRRAEPDVEIDLLRRRRVRLHADAPARLVAEGPRDQQLAELSRTGWPRRPPPTSCRSGSACRAGRSGCTSGRPRRRRGPRARCGCTASRRTRPCRPGRPRWSSARASGWAWRSRWRRPPCPPGRGGCPSRWPAPGPRTCRPSPLADATCLSRLSYVRESGSTR